MRYGGYSVVLHFSPSLLLRARRWRERLASERLRRSVAHTLTGGKIWL